MVLMDMTVRDFVAELASSSPAPGGGTIAATNGSFAAGLGEMICQLTLQNPKEAGAETALPQLRDKLKKARQRLIELADEDTEAFNQVMAAFRLPKQTEGEKETRRTKIAEANTGATKVPLETAKEAVAVCEHLEEAVKHVNENVLSDCGVGIECARTAAIGAFMNVAINLPGIKDEAMRSRFESSLKDLKQRLERSYQAAAQSLSGRFTY